MKKYAILLTLILMFPGCFGDDEEEISFHGRDLGGSYTYKFTLEDAEGPLWSLQ